MKTLFLLDPGVSGMIAEIKDERAEIERLRGMIDGQRRLAYGHSL